MIRTELRLPPPDIQLARHLSSLSLRAQPSGAGQLARTLLDRISDNEGLDALALPHALSILQALIAPSRKKLAQRIRRELQDSGMAAIDEDRVVELLGREGLFAELATRTLAQLQGTLGVPPKVVLSSVGPLCDAAFLQRGRAFACPLCGIKDYLRLAELNDRVACRACRQEFPLPAVENGQEAPTAYRLDGLMARAMDQDIVPVLLTLRYLLRRPEASNHAHWWPGLDLYENDSIDADYEIDLLIADGGRLLVCQVKRDAGGLTRDEAIRHFDLAHRLGGQPVLSAPAGDWRSEITNLFDSYEFLLLDKSTLIESMH
jgi:hypothetical protein